MVFTQGMQPLTKTGMAMSAARFTSARFAIRTPKGAIWYAAGSDPSGIILMLCFEAFKYTADPVQGTGFAVRVARN